MPEQAPALTPIEAEPNRGLSMMESFRSSRLGRIVTAGVASLTLASSAEAGILAFNAEPVAGDNIPTLLGTYDTFAAAEATQSSGEVLHRHSNLTTQTMLDKIYKVMHRFSDDNTQNNNCHLGGYNPFPKVPCSHNRVVPTSAFLNPNAGGFKTDCKNPYISTYHYYKITPIGQSYHTCGPGVIPGGLGNPDQKSTPGEFQKKLNFQGNIIQKSVKLNYQETSARVGGNRKEIAATYKCPIPDTDSGLTGQSPQPKGVKKIIINRNHTATTVMC